MSNNVSPSQIIHYISEEKCILVGRNNQPNQQLLKFDYKLNSTFKFQIINKINQIITPDADEYELFGSFVDSKQNLHILFYTKIQASDITNNTLSFDVDSYTSEYLNNVKNQRQIDVSIVAIKNNVAKSMILRDIGLAFPRPYVTGRTPIEIVSHNVFMNLNSPVTGSLNVGSEFTDIAVDLNTFSFGEGLYTDTENQVVIGTYNVPSATTHKAFVIGNGSSDSQRSNSFSIDLSGNVEANSIIINGSSVATADDLTGFATEQYVDAAVSGKADLSSVYTKEEVYTYIETDAKINNLSAATDEKIDAVSAAIPTKVSQLTNDLGYLTGVDLTDYATKQWVEDKNYITGYTAGSGIQINNNVISLTGQLGETYTADEDTLKLVNNQFSIKSVFPMIKSAGGVTITKDSEGITYLKVSSGGGGGTSTEYFAGTGLELGSDPELPETTFSINTTWLANQISAATSGLQNYSAGSGISIDANNVISVTGMVTTDQIANMATTGWVTGYCSSFITEDAIEGLATESDLQIVSAAIPTDYLVQDDLSSYVTSAALTGELDNYVLKTDLPNDIVTSGDITGFITSDWLEENGYVTTGDLNDLSTTLSSALTSNVETLSTAIDTKVTSAQVTELITGYVGQNLSAVSQLVNDTGFITLASLDEYAQLSDIPVVTDFVTEDELSATSAAIVNLIPEVSGKADLSAVEAVDAKFANYSTTEQIASTYATKEEIPSLTAYATTGYVDAAVSGKADLSALNDLATEEDLQAVSAVVSAKADKSYVDQTFLSAIPDEYVTATELATELQPYALSANVDTSIAAATGTVTSWVDGKGYLTAHQDLTNYATNDNVTAASANAVNVATGWVAEQDYLTAHQSLDNYYNKTEVDTAIETASGNIETWVGQQGYLTAHQSLDAYATQQWVEDKHYLTGVDLTNYATKSQIPTKVSDLENDKGYITGIANNALLSDIKTYTAGTGLELNGTEFSLTAQIPSDEDISGIASAVTTDYLEDYDTSTEVDTKIETAIQAIVFPEGVNYTAGEGLGLSSTQNGKEFYLTAHIPTNDEITGLASSYVDTLNIATIYATKDELNSKADQNDFASVCGVLSGAIDLKANSADVYTALSADQTFATKSELQTVSSAIPTATISAITIVHEADEDYTYNTDTIKFNSDFNVDDNGDSVSINWAGFDVYPAQGDSWKTKCIEFTNDFVAQSSEEWLTLSINTDILSSYALKTDIPTATIDALTGNVEFLSGAITGVANDLSSNYLKTADYNEYTDTDVATYLTTNDYVTSSTVSTALSATSAAIKADIPTAVTDLDDAANYAQLSDIPAPLTSVANFLSAGDNINLTTVDGVTTISAASGGGGGTTYQAGNYISLVNDTIAVTGLTPPTNKQAAYNVGGNTISYDSNYDIFKTSYTGSTLTLNTVTVTTSQLSSGEIATFEEWISLNNDIPSADFSAGSNVFVGEIPSALLSSKTHVFTRRLVNNNGTITQYVSYAYEF